MTLALMARVKTWRAVSLQACVSLFDGDFAFFDDRLASEADTFVEFFFEEGDALFVVGWVQVFFTFDHFDHAGRTVAFAAAKGDIGACIVDGVADAGSVFDVYGNVILWEINACHDVLRPCGGGGSDCLPDIDL